MSTLGIIGEEMEQQAALASAARKNIDDAEAGERARQVLPRAVLDMLRPYAAALYIADRVVQSATYDRELVQSLHAKLLPLEQMAKRTLATARERSYFEDPEAGEPLRCLESCNEQIKDCIVALESMLDPELDAILRAALEEHGRGETIPLKSIS